MPFKICGQRFRLSHEILATTRTFHQKTVKLLYSFVVKASLPENLQRPIFSSANSTLIHPSVVDLDFLRRRDEEHFECIMWAAAAELASSINSDISFSSLTRASQCLEGWIIQKFSQQDCCSLLREQYNVKSFPTREILNKFTYSWKHFQDCLGWQFLGGERGFADFWRNVSSAAASDTFVQLRFLDWRPLKL